MTEKVRIPRKTEGASPPYWEPWKGRVLLKCANGHLATLDHDIKNDGTVSPSIVCPENCGWHVWGILEEWKPPSDP